MPTHGNEVLAHGQEVLARQIAGHGCASHAVDERTRRRSTTS
jgi:hypothetical protein